MWSDLPAEHWAHPYIQALANRNILQGFPDGQFYADANITRAQFAAVVSKAFDTPDRRDSIQFQDVPLSHWAVDAIKTAYRQGFLSGYPDRRFKPEQPITRAEVLVSLANGLGYTPQATVDTTLATYQDQARIPDFARSPIAAATEKYLVVNYPTVTLLNPRRYATRAEVAAILYQALVSRHDAVAIASPYIPSPPTIAVANTDQLIEQLQDPDEAVRQQATQALVNSQADAIPILVNALQTKPAVQSSVSNILVTISSKATPVLVAALQQETGSQQVMDTLVRIGAVSTLIGALENDKTLERAGTVLVRIGQPAVPELIAALQKETLHDKAVAVLTEIGEPALADLVAALKGDSTLVRKGIATVLQHLGQPAIAALVAALPTQDSQLKTGIAAVVKQLNQPAISALVAALEKDNRQLQESIADVLAQVGQPAIAELVAGLNTDNATYQDHLAFVLKTIGQPTAAELITAIKADQGTVSQRAAQILTAIGQPAAAELIASLNQESLLAPESKAGQLIQTTLGEVIGTDAVSTLVTSLRAYYAKSSQTETIPVAQDVLEQLNLLKQAGNNTTTLEAIALTLNQFGVTAVKGVTDLLQDDNPIVRASAVYVLGKMGPKATAAIPVLIQQLQQGDAQVKSQISHALNQIDPVVTRVLLIASLLSAGQAQERVAAAQTIGVLTTTPTTVAVPDFVDQALTSALETAQQTDESPTVRAASAAALG